MARSGDWTTDEVWGILAAHGIGEWGCPECGHPVLRAVYPPGYILTDGHRSWLDPKPETDIAKLECELCDWSLTPEEKFREEI